MKERPILFSTEMVRAILEGRKTQTRRVITKKLPDELQNYKMCWPGKGCPSHWKDKFGIMWEIPSIKNFKTYDFIVCPYGAPGDLLYVRETWTLEDFQGNDLPVYKANLSNTAIIDSYTWRPSIFMPKKYARIWLRMIDVRVERVQDISWKDCGAEGAGEIEEHGRTFYNGSYLIGSFRHLWNKINASRGYGWDTNPWVWVVEFERVEADND